MVQHGTKGWEVGFRGWEITAGLEGLGVLVPGLGRQAGLYVICISVAHRANHGPAIRCLGEPRNQLAVLHARDAGGNGPEFTADLDGTGRLGIKGFLLGMSTMQEQHDHALGLAKGG